nr:protein FAM111A-like isoform X2 [Paramormyrops kingsleyae]
MASNQTSAENPAASSANQNLAVRVKTEPDDEKTTLGQKHSHSFYYQINKENHMVTCTKRGTVLEALQADPPFRTFLERNREKGKSIIIERDNSFIATHFPCWLFKDEETVLIKSFPGEAAEVSDGYEIKDGDIVTFCISSIGGLNMRKRRFLRNSKLQNNKSLCIYAYIGETVEDALKRDGRFIDEVFQGSVSLCEEGEQQTNIQLTTKIPPKFGNLKTLQLKKTALKRPAEDKTANKRKLKSGRKSDPSSNTENPSTRSSSVGSKPSSDKAMAVKGPDLYKKVHEIPDSTEILEILREQFQGLVELMKKRHKKRKVEDVVELLREEFGKNIQSFSEISTGKKLMNMSASVCYIEVENHMRGTGFLLFDRYILTNAHVIKDITNGTVLGRKVHVTFAFEDLTEESKNLWCVKEEVVAGWYGLDQQERLMDFALLELGDSLGKPDLKLPPTLLREYAPFPGKGGICLIGHPHGGVKKMDSSSIIEVKKRANAVKRQFGRKGRHIQYINDLKDKELTYNTCFFHGSSGSPIFGENCKLVGLHTGGFLYEIAGEQKSVIEFGISMRSILEHLLLQMMDEKKCELLSKLIAETMKSKSTIQVVAGFICYMLQMWKEDLDSVLSTVITTAKKCGESSELRTSLCEIIPKDDLQTLMKNLSSSMRLSELSEILKEEETPMDIEQQTAGN